MVKQVGWMVVVVAACAAPATEVTSSAVAGSTIVALTFDDTFADNLQVGALTEARGMRATFFVNSGRLGAAGSLTRDELFALQARGHEIAGHTVSHANLATLDEAEMRRQVCTDRVALLAAGFRVTSFAYPFSAQDATARQVVADCGYNSARLVGGLVNPGSCAGCPYANAVPPAEHYQLRTNDSVKADTTLATLQAAVENAETHGGGFVPFVFHHVCDGCDPLAVSPALLADFLDWLVARGTVVATVDEVIGGALQPAVAAPAPEVSPPGSNLLRNASLEVDDNADQLPDCWQRGGTGESVASYALVGGAFDGNRAQRIDITSWTSGVRRLVSRQDLGGCAPVAVPGHRYRVSAAYLATAPVQLAVYYRNAAGGWVWFAQSAQLPASAAYTVATYTTPAFPAGATAISVGLSLVNVGSVTMDAFTLVDLDAPPTARIASPADGATVTGITPIWADVSAGVYRVRFYRDGVQLGTRVQTTFRWNWDTATATIGAHTLEIQAEDEAGRATRSAPITVNVIR